MSNSDRVVLRKRVADVSDLPAELWARAEGWARRWGVPKLRDSVTIEFSPRFRTTLGRCNPVQRRIRLASFLCEKNPELLAETLCHELAHIAAHSLHGARARPHGPEWRLLVAQAGFFPRTRAQAEEVDHGPAAARPRALWEHRCPVCQTVRVAGRSVRTWRCAECLDAGLSGELAITRIPPPDEALR